MSVGKLRVFLLLLLSLLACSPTKETSTIRISGPFEAVSLDPSISGFMFLRLEVMQTLVDVDSHGNLTPALATDWQVSNDGKRWLFSLQQQVQLHNGRIMNSDDVVRSLRFALNKPGPIQLAHIKAIKSLTKSQIEIELEEPYRALPAVMTNYSTAILASESFADNGEIVQLIGTGPYKLKKFQPPHKIQVSRFDQYWANKAEIKNVEYITGHRSESRAMMVRTGQADIVFNLAPATLPSLKNEKGVTIKRVEIPRSILVKLNLAQPALSSLNVRKALSLSLDRKAIAKHILNAPGSESEQIFGPILSNWHLKQINTTAKNLTKARELLLADGWQLNPEGVWIKNKRPLKFELVTYANRPELIVLATVLQAQWRQLGVLLDVSMENASAVPSKHANGSLEMALISRNFGTIGDPLGLIMQEFGSPEGGDWGPMNWYNKTVFDQLKQLRTLSDDRLYHSLAQQTSAKIMDDMPMIPIAFYMQSSALSKSIKNFVFDPFERSFLISKMSLKDAR